MPFFDVLMGAADTGSTAATSVNVDGTAVSTCFASTLLFCLAEVYTH